MGYEQKVQNRKAFFTPNIYQMVYALNPNVDYDQNVTPYNSNLKSNHLRTMS